MIVLILITILLGLAAIGCATWVVWSLIDEVAELDRRLTQHELKDGTR